MKLSSQQQDWLSSVCSCQTITQMPVYGSKRSFFTVSDGCNQRVLIVDDDPTQFENYLKRAELFRSLHVRVPEVFASDAPLGLILVEYLPGILLEYIYQNDADYALSYYSVIDVLADWQNEFEQHGRVGQKGLIIYDEVFARNETRYFQQRFLGDYLRLAESQIRSLDNELDKLAEQAASIPKTLMHRDFQSQNIIMNDGKPSFVDFQTAMMGPYCYDLASLLFDNYVNIPISEKKNMRDYFFSKLNASRKSDFSICALQRTFQALGAYGYISGYLCRKQYLRHIPQGIQHLTQLADDFPWIKSLLFPILF